MNREERGNLAAVIDKTARYYGKKIEPDVFSMMIDDLEDLEINAVMLAYMNYRRNPQNKFSPMPAQIRELVSPSVSNDSLAKEAAARIPEAIKKFGYTDPESAKAFIGSLGWNVVNRFGGWAHVCQHHGTPEMNALTFQAQARDLARSHLEFSAAGKLGVAPEISAPAKTSNQLSSASQIIKTLISTNKEGENLP